MLENIKHLLINNIRLCREKLQMTQAEAAEAIGISLSGYAQLEYGKTWVSAETLEKISKAFKIEVYELFKNHSINDIKPENRSDLILSIIARISALNEAELMALDAVIRNSDAFIDGGSFVVSSAPNHSKTR